MIKINKNDLLENVLFIQDSPACIRTIKLATALKAIGLKIHLVHLASTPNEDYGFGNESFESLNKMPNKVSDKIIFIKELIEKFRISLVHFHNYPDKLGAKIIQSNISVPFIYDQHDFMSQKMKYLPFMKYYEKICNEDNDGAVYITENYRKLVAKKYQINNNNIVFGSYGIAKLVPDIKSKYKAKLREKKRIDVVYIGFITEHKGIVRYMLDIFKTLSENEINIHIYPTRKKEYKKYSSIPNIVLHKQMPINELITELDKYDFGIAFLNHRMKQKRRAEEVKYGFWNKINDYLVAGIPILTMNYYDDMSAFVKENNFGISVENFEDISFQNLKDVDVMEIRNNILVNRKKHFMENQIYRVHDFYKRTLHLFNDKNKR